MQNNIHIQTVNLNVSFGKLQVLKNINLSIPSNKITAILGPSGCGKTTLLRCFNRLVDNEKDIKLSGQVLLRDKNILATSTDVTTIRKKMGLLSQRPFPLPLSIYENVAYGPRLHGRPTKPELDALVEKRLRQARLWDEVRDRLHEPAAKLSIGQQQRLCLARGLAVDPEIILADEPTSALDPVSSRGIEELFLELKQNYTIVLVTHILRQARRLADYVAFVYLGEVIESGPTSELFENPKEKLTQEYLSGAIS